MPVQIINKEFQDLFGVKTNYYHANAGDPTQITLEIEEKISVQSGGSVGILEIDPVNNIVIWNTGNFLDEGFRPGDNVSFRIFSSSGSLLHSWSASVNSVTANTIDVSTITNLYDYTAGEILLIFVEDRKRESLTLMLNHVSNGTTGSEFSSIDGEATIFHFNLNAYVNGATYTGIQVGNASGQFLCTAEILDNTDYTSGIDTRSYSLVINIIQSGVYQSNLFDFSNCLKFYAKFKWQSLQDEPFNNYIHIFNDDANTGWYNQAFNVDLLNASILTGITQIDYVYPTSGYFIIDSTETNFAFGCAYVSNDSAYYKNRPYNQSELSMIIDTRQFTIGAWEYSSVNEFGGQYAFRIDNILTSGTQHTISFSFEVVTSAFSTFIEDQEPDNRTLYIWARLGNVNLLVFNQNMITQPPVGGAIDVVQNIFLDHSENVTTSTESANDYTANIEDDLAFTGKFLLNNGEVYDHLTAYVEAVNSVTNESFILESVLFDFASVPFNGTKHLLNFNLPVQSQLPLTSEKRNALCVLDTSIDTMSQYGIQVYFPFLYRWEYWLQQLNASIDFYPNNQTKNWYTYDSTPDWNVKFHLEAVKNGLAYTFDNELVILPYESNKDIKQTIELFIDSTNTQVGVVVENELMRVVAYHELQTFGVAWKQSEVWGMITIEPTESSPRYLVSSVVPFDNNVNNPLYPMSGLLVQITFPVPNVARMECYFDPTKINLENGCKFTTKIKGCTESYVPEVEKIMTDGTKKITTTEETKILA